MSEHDTWHVWRLCEALNPLANRLIRTDTYNNRLHWHQYLIAMTIDGTSTEQNERSHKGEIINIGCSKLNIVISYLINLGEKIYIFEIRIITVFQLCLSWIRDGISSRCCLTATHVGSFNLLTTPL